MPTHIADGGEVAITVAGLCGSRTLARCSAASSSGSTRRSIATAPDVIRANSAAVWNVRTFWGYVPGSFLLRLARPGARQERDEQGRRPHFMRALYGSTDARVPRPRRAALWTIACLFALVLPVLAQRGGGRRFFVPIPGGVDYDGQLTIVRLYYANYPGWSYDYPDMEQNFTLILKDISLLPARKEGSKILRMDDPELLKFPIAYLSEPGYWYPTDSEAEGLRTYLAKGGFLIVDDFHFEREWAVFEAAMRKVLPAARVDQLDKTPPGLQQLLLDQVARRSLPRPARRAGADGRVLRHP